MLSGKSVLIVEDAALIAIDIETVLDELGAALIVAGAVAPTASTAGEFVPDLAIVDIHSAEGVDGALVVRLRHSGVPIVFLATDPDFGAASPIEGAHAVVFKPFTHEDLSAAIGRLTG